MNPLPPVCETPKPSFLALPSPIRVRSSQFREYLSKRRRWLWTGVVIVFICMITSLIFLAHKFFVEFGGQGVLKSREEPPPQPTIFLPQRQIQLEKQGRGKNVPYYACGDQLDSCGEHNQLNICCPVNMYCHGPTPYTLSGIFCCNATSPSDCRVSKDNSPQCPTNTFQCNSASGGGCCKNNTVCTPNGCVRFIAPSIISDNPTTKTKSTASPYSGITSIQNGSAAFTTGSILISTVTERPAATATDVKQGEVAQDKVQNGGSYPQPLFMSLYIRYASLVVLMAVLMGVL